MVWYSHLLQNFPQFVVIHTVKGFSIVNEVPVLWHFPSLGLEWKLTFLLLFNITFIIVLFNITFIKVTYARVLYLTVPTSQVALVKNTPANAGDIRDMDLIPESWRASWKRAWQPTLIFLPGEFCGQRSLAATVHGVAKRWIGLKWLNTQAYSGRGKRALFTPLSKCQWV